MKARSHGNEHTDPLRQIMPPVFSDVFALVLETHGITKYRFANVSNLDPAHVSRLARGLRSRPQADTVRKIERALARLNVPDHEIDKVVGAAGFGAPEVGVTETVHADTAVKSTSAPEETLGEDVMQPMEIGPLRFQPLGMSKLLSVRVGIDTGAVKLPTLAKKWRPLGMPDMPKSS